MLYAPTQAYHQWVTSNQWPRYVLWLWSLEGNIVLKFSLAPIVSITISNKKHTHAPALFLLISHVATSDVAPYYHYHFNRMNQPKVLRPAIKHIWYTSIIALANAFVHLLLFSAFSSYYLQHHSMIQYVGKHRLLVLCICSTSSSAHRQSPVHVLLLVDWHSHIYENISSHTLHFSIVLYRIWYHIEYKSKWETDENVEKRKIKLRIAIDFENRFYLYNLPDSAHSIHTHTHYLLAHHITVRDC